MLHTCLKWQRTIINICLKYNWESESRSAVKTAFSWGQPSRAWEYRKFAALHCMSLAWQTFWCACAKEAFFVSNSKEGKAPNASSVSVCQYWSLLSCTSLLHRWPKEQFFHFLQPSVKHLIAYLWSFSSWDPNHSGNTESTGRYSLVSRLKTCKGFCFQRIHFIITTTTPQHSSIVGCLQTICGFFGFVELLHSSG